MRRALRLVLAGALTVICLGGGSAAAATITVHRGATTRPRPRNFISLSLTYRAIERWTGPPGQPVDPVLVQLVHNLDPGGMPILRVGGQGADRTWWPVPGVRRPLGVSNSLSPRFTDAARRLAQALPARYLLGINLEAGSPRIAHVEADHLVAGIGRARVAALEIGNEPDLYTSIPWYWRASDGRALPWYADRGTPVYSRGPGYGPAAFVSEVKRTMRVLPRGIPIAGPDLVSPAWLPAFAALMTRRSRVRFLDVHAYPLVKCVTDPADPRFPSVAHLLALGASRDLLAGAGPFVGLARREHGQFLVDELGTDSCGGLDRVDETLASALWAVDALFSLDRAGVDGVALHTIPGLANGLFDLRERHGRWRAEIHPLYEGALLFADAAPAGSRLLPVTGADPATLRTWATIAPDHLVRVVLVNPGAATTATIRAPAGYGSLAAEVQRLRAAGNRAGARRGITFAGRMLTRSSTGILPRPHPSLARARAGGYRVALPAASAALITLSPRRRR
jgi:hypothetical protein